MSLCGNRHCRMCNARQLSEFQQGALNQPNKNSSWTKLASVPYRYYCLPLAIEEDKLLMISEHLRGHLYYYDIKLDEWMLYVGDMKQDCAGSVFSAAACIHNGNVYVCNDYNGRAFMLDSIKKQWIRLNTNHTKRKGKYPSIISVDGVFHCIAAGRHYIWPKDSIPFETSYDSMKVINRCSNQMLIHIQSKNEFLLLGGYDESEGVISALIYSYAIASNKWKCLKERLDEPLSSFGCVLTLDEKHLILFGGYTPYGKSNKIYVIQLGTMTITESEIRCPQKGWYHAVIANDYITNNTIAFGFVPNFVPDELKAVIALFCYTQTVYLFQEKCLWKMNVSRLLTDCMQWDKVSKSKKKKLFSLQDFSM